MSHDEYRHGSCVDKTVDMIDLMIRSGDDAYRQEVGAWTGNVRVVSPAAAEAAAGDPHGRHGPVADERVLAFTPAPTSPLVADLANRAPPRQRGAVRAEVTSELQLYRQLARRHGFAPNMLSSGTLYATRWHTRAITAMRFRMRRNGSQAKTLRVSVTRFASSSRSSSNSLSARDESSTRQGGFVSLRVHRDASGMRPAKPTTGPRGGRRCCDRAVVAFGRNRFGALAVPRGLMRLVHC